MEARKAYANSAPKRRPVTCTLAPMVPFNDNHARPAPTVFYPNGNFDSLRQQGKLRDGSTLEGEAARRVMQRKKHFVPGYTGFVRGSQHIAGRTFGAMTRKAYDTPFNDTVCVSPIPSAPNANRLVPQRLLENTFVTRNMSHRTNKIPGYTGHIPQARQMYASTYGEITINAAKNFSSTLTHPRKSSIERPGYAYTTYSRNFQTIDSAPLPGTKSGYHKPPVMMIPGHLKNTCTYFSG